MRTPLIYGAESLHFQDTTFFKELSLQYENLQSLPENEIPDGPGLVALSQIIKKHTGMTVVIDIPAINAMGPYVEIPSVDRNHPLINNAIRNYASSASGIRLIEEAKGVARGSVDLMTGKVSGIFAEIESRVVMPIQYVKKSAKGFLPEELAAITLHEVGHLFTYYEFITRSVTTNQVLAGLAKELDGSGGPSQREAALIAVKKAANMKDLEASELAKCGNNKVIEIVVVSNSVRQSESELGRNIYDTSTWEYLADQYVARQGGSRYLVSALDKIYRGSWNISFRSLPAFLAFEAFKLLVLIANPFLGLIFIVMDGQGDGTYDTPGARMKRIRSQVVENLKDKNLSKEDIERLQADVALIDDMMRQANDRRQFIGVLWDFFSPTARKDRSYTLLQKELEAIAANDLFAKAASLRQMA